MKSIFSRGNFGNFGNFHAVIFIQEERTLGTFIKPKCLTFSSSDGCYQPALPFTLGQKHLPSSIDSTDRKERKATLVGVFAPSANI
jgi:hypothetical protein